MAKSSKLLTEYISTKSIVGSVGDGVKTLPAVLQCPNPECQSRTSFVLYSDPKNPAGSAVWGCCASCGTTGDAVALYCVSNSISSSWEAVEKIHESGFLLTSINTAKNCYAEYELARQMREKIDEFWVECRDGFRSYPGTHPVISAQGLSLDRNVSFGFMGASTTARIKDVLGVDIKSRKDVTILPFYDVPGRIASFRVYFLIKGLVHSRDIPLSYASQHGMYMLNGIRLHTEAVLAVDDPMLAFKIQNRCILTNMTPWPIIAYTSNSAKWDSITADKIVFLTDKFHTDLFAAAKNTPNAYICKPPPEFDIHKKLKYCSPRGWMNELLQYSVHWTTALATWLCHGIQREEAACALDQLDLSPGVRRDLVDSLNDFESKKMLSQFMSSSAYAKRLIFEGTKISEHDGKWYTAKPATQREYLISDCVIKLTSTVRAGEDNYYVGEVVRRGARRKFFVSTKIPRTHQRRWLENFCLKHDMGFPDISSVWDHKLFAVARAFSGELPNEIIDAKVGWSRDFTVFRLPNRVVQEGKIINEIGIPVDSYPCQRVTGRGITPSMIRSLLSNSPGNSEFWALFACSMTNLMAPLIKAKPKCIGVVGDTGFGETFAKAMDFVQYSSICHDVPSLFEPAKVSAPILRGLTDTTKNAIIDLSPLSASFVICDSWVFIQANQSLRSWTPDPFVYDLTAHAIRFIQGGYMSVSTYAPATFLTEFSKFLTLRFFNGNAPDYQKMLDAVNLISIGIPFGGTSPGDAFLYGVFLMMQAGDVTTSSRKGSIMIDETTVCLPKNVVMSILAGETAYVRGDLKLRKVLTKNSSTGWYINRKYWDTLFSKFDKEYSF